MGGNLPSHKRRSRRRLAGLLSRGRFDIIEAALLVAAEEYPALDVQQESRRVDRIADGARKRVRGLANPFERLDRLASYLFEELGFCGNDRDYYDPRNSFLNEVLDRRIGIPLTLSLVFMSSARSAGFEARGIALPGHFVVGLVRDGRGLLVDPFHGAAVITEEDCQEIVVRVTGRPSLFQGELLDGAPPKEILGRLLRNLKRIYLAQKDFERALHAVDRLLMVFPGEPTERRDRGFLLAHLDRPGAAMSDLESYLALVPDAPDARAVRGRIAWLRRRTPDID